MSSEDAQPTSNRSTHSAARDLPRPALTHLLHHPIDDLPSMRLTLLARLNFGEFCSVGREDRATLCSCFDRDRRSKLVREELEGTTIPVERDFKRKDNRNAFCRTAWTSGQLEFTVERKRGGMWRTPQVQARQPNADERTSLAEETNLTSVSGDASAPPGWPRRKSELNLRLQEMLSPRRVC